MRKVKNFLESFELWATTQNSESPMSFIRWAGLFTIASSLKRHVWIPQKYMGGYTIYPNLFLFFVGPAGGPRKTTTLGFAKKLLSRNKSVNIVPKQISASDLVRFMADCRDGSCTVLSGEVSSFLNTTLDDLVDLLTDLYDNDDKFDRGTRAHGTEVVNNPSVNIFACTTPDWIAANASSHFIGGGFSSRIIFIYEEHKRSRKLYYNLDERQLTMLQSDLVDTLKHITKLAGPFSFESQSLMDMIETWYNEELPKETHHKMEGYFNRKHLHLHKLMMLLSVSERDDLVLTRDHFEKAKKLLGEIEEFMFRAVAYAGNNPSVGTMDKILRYVKTNGKVRYRDIFRHFYQDVDEAELNRLLSSLQALGELSVESPPNSALIDRLYF